MGVEFLKIKEVDEAKEIINEKFNEYYTPQLHSVRLKVKLIFHHLTGL